MIHIPVLRWGEPYKSLEVDKVVHFDTGEVLAEVSRANAALVDRIVPLSRRARFLAEAEKLASLRVSRADLSTVHRIADGALSPLVGPMREATYHRVLDEKRFLVGAKSYAWTIPLGAANG